METKPMLVAALKACLQDTEHLLASCVSAYGSNWNLVLEGRSKKYAANRAAAHEALFAVQQELNKAAAEPVESITAALSRELTLAIAQRDWAFKQITAGNMRVIHVLEEAFLMGFYSPETYNDKVENSASECWQKNKAYFIKQLQELK